MSEKMSRRTFVKSAGATGAALAASNSASAEQDKLCLAMVGTHHIHAPGYADRLKKAESVTVKYVWDPDAARAKEWASRLNAAVAKSPEEVWGDSQVRGAVICSETNLHHGLVLGGAKAKKHMFVEKPLGAVGKEAREMAQAMEQAGIHFTTGYFMRTSPQHLLLKEMVDKGAFGTITRVRGVNIHNGALGGWFDTEWRWMADPKAAGAGGFMDLGTHSLDIMMWLLGDIASVTADVRSITNRYANCDETGEAMIRFKNGAVGSLVGGWVDVANPVTLEIYGTEGHATIFNGRLYLTGGKGYDGNGRDPYTKLPPSPPQPLDQWLAAVAGQSGMPLVTPHEAAARVGVMEAMYRSNTERKWLAPM